MKTITVRGIDPNVAEKSIKTATPVPTNGIWIAAVAFQHGLKLFTKDAHFSFVKGLMLI
jgi:tRNA(fMet)-specific endonuclease VapC